MGTREITPLIGMMEKDHLFFSMIFGLGYILLIENKSEMVNLVNMGALTQLVYKGKDTMEEVIPDNSELEGAFLKTGNHIEALCLTLNFPPIEKTVYSGLKNLIKSRYRSTMMREAMDPMKFTSNYLEPLESRLNPTQRLTPSILTRRRTQFHVSSGQGL